MMTGESVRTWNGESSLFWQKSLGCKMQHCQTVWLKVMELTILPQAAIKRLSCPQQISLILITTLPMKWQCHCDTIQYRHHELNNAHATASMKYIPHHEKKGSRKHIIDLHHKIQRNSWPLSILHWSDFKFKCTKTDRHFGLGSTRVIRSHPLRVTSWMALLDGFWGFVLFSALTIGLKAGRHWLLTRGHWRDVCFDCMLRLLTMVHNYCLSYSSCLLNCSYIL